MVIRVGLIGYGEVGSIFSKALLKHDIKVTVYDICFFQGKKLEEKRAEVIENNLNVDTLAGVIEKSQYIFSTVTTQVARDVARECKPYLKPGQVFVDLNSTSPYIKIELHEIIRKSGAEFIEGAILGAVGATGAKTKILIGGENGEEIAEVLTGMGLNAKFYHSEIGKASMFKMLRSIFSKGLEAILVELLISGKKAGIEKDLWNVIVDLMTNNDFNVVASNWLVTHATACERRYFELKQVVETMTELGVDPLMTEATKNFFERSVSLNLNRADDRQAESKETLIDYYLEQLGSFN